MTKTTTPSCAKACDSPVLLDIDPGPRTGTSIPNAGVSAHQQGQGRDPSGGT